MSSPLFALVDCNNFYASCESLFRPDLRDRPLVVLSNNDGCVIARSHQAKALGIKMGVPAFKIRPLLAKAGVEVFSSNYALYADMSARVMQTLETLAPAVEVYSIDEAFLDLSGLPSAQLYDFGIQVRHTIATWLGITVCVGIAPTKTLAKLANHAAKRWPVTDGVVDLTSRERQRKLMALLPVESIWGVGRRLAKQLQGLNIQTALQLADADSALIRKTFSVVLERTVRELNGQACFTLDDVPAHKQQIVCSRSFGERVTDLTSMRSAITRHISRAGEKLRAEAQCARTLTLFIRTSPFNRTEPHYSNSATAELPYPSDDSRDLLQLGLQLLAHIWRDGYRYAKAGVMLSNFYPPQVAQYQLFDARGHYNKPCGQLMQVMDNINQNGTRIWFASQDRRHNWQMKRGRLSPAYTTRWSDLPLVR